MPTFDHTPGLERTEERLREAVIGWLGTVRPDGRPHLVPVWFFWTGVELLITAEVGSQKIANLRENSALSFALDDSREGHEPILLEGHAEVETATEQDQSLDAFYEKYRSTMDAMNWTEVEARRTHNTLIRVRIDRLIIF